MNSFPLVSIPLLTYNSAFFIKETLESILHQDYQHFEIIVSDDASTDETPEILKKYQEQYPNNIKVILNLVNQGVTKNANTALKHCKGEYIALLGGDDIFLPGKLRKQVLFMEKHEEVLISYHNVAVFDSKSNKTLYNYNAWGRNKPRAGDFSTLIKYGCFCFSCSVMIKREAIPARGYDEIYPACSDFVLYLQTLLSGGKIAYIPEVLSKYRRHENNITNENSPLYKQVYLDAFNISTWIMFNYPEYAHYAINLYANNLRGLRKIKGVSYLSILWKSYLISPNLKVFLGMACYIFSFGKIRL